MSGLPFEFDPDNLENELKELIKQEQLPDYEQDSYFAAVAVWPVLERHSLVPAELAGKSYSPMETYELVTYFGDDESDLFNDFKYKAGAITGAYEAASWLGFPDNPIRDEDQSDFDDKLIECMGCIALDPKDLGLWLNAMKDIFGQLPVLDPDKPIADQQEAIDMLADLQTAKYVFQAESNAKKRLVRNMLTETLIEKFGMHDDMSRLVNQIELLAFMKAHSPDRKLPEYAYEDFARIGMIQSQLRDIVENIADFYSEDRA